MRNFHQRYYPGNTISVGIGQGETQVTPLQLARALGGIASNGNFVRPHVVMADQNIPADFRQAVLDSFPGSGDKKFPLNPDTWSIITDGMAAATTTGTAAASHLQGIDFAGKTGTAQVVGGGDTHTKGGAKTPNSWFVGMVPRRNPEIVIAVLQEHGDWGSLSAHIAAQMVVTYVNKKRRAEHNLLDQASLEKPVEMRAIWSQSEPAGSTGSNVSGQDAVLHAGSFMVDPGSVGDSKTLASGLPRLPAWLFSSPLRFKEGKP